MPFKGDHNVLTNTYNTIFIMYEQENKGDVKNSIKFFRISLFTFIVYN